MKSRILMVSVVLAALFFVTGILYAANGDLIVNGNLGVGTTTPQGKAEVNGNMIVDGDTTTKGNTTTNGNTIVNGNLGVGTTSPTEKAEVNGNLKVNGNLCVGDNCTNSLQVSGGLYGWCRYQFCNCLEAKSPASCNATPYTCPACVCPSGYTLVDLGAPFVACYKN